MNNVKWKPGVVLEKLGPLCYFVEVEGKRWKRHIDQLKVREPSKELGSTVNHEYLQLSNVPNARVLPADQFSLDQTQCSHALQLPQAQPTVQEPVSPQVNQLPPPTVHSPQTVSSSTPELTSAPPVLRRSGRTIKPPNRLNL